MGTLVPTGPVASSPMLLSSRRSPCSRVLPGACYDLVGAVSCRLDMSPDAGNPAAPPVDCCRASSASCGPTRWRRSAQRRPRPPGPGPPGRLRRLRRLGARRGRRQADLLRPLRAPAPRPGVGRDRGEQRSPDPGLQGHGPGLAGLRRDHPRLAQGPPRDRARRYSTTGRASGRTRSRRSAPPPTARSRWATTATSSTPTSCASMVDDLPPAPRASSTSTPATSRPRPTTPGWSPHSWRTTRTPRWSSGRSRCCRPCRAPSASSG